MFFFFVLSCLTLNSYAQTDEFEPLDMRNEDEVRVDLMFEQFDNLFYSDPESAEVFAQEALALSKKAGYECGVTDGYNALGVLSRTSEN